MAEEFSGLGQQGLSRSASVPQCYEVQQRSQLSLAAQAVGMKDHCSIILNRAPIDANEFRLSARLGDVEPTS